MLAIVIPYYKIDFFEETLKSVASQKDKRFTLYIGNDASPDDPFPLIEKYFPNGNYHYFDYKENLGGKNLAMQWERILENVIEEWFQILGDDDVISENFVEQFYKNLPEAKKNGSNIIKFSQCQIDENSVKITDFTAYPTTFSSIENFKQKFLLGHRSSLSEYIFRIEIYKKYNFKKFPLAWHSDDYAVLQFSGKSDIYFIDKAKVLVRVSDKSISGSNHGEEEKKLATYQFMGEILNNHTELLPEKFIREKMQWQIDTAYRNRWKLNINLLRLYLSLKDYTGVFRIPKIYFYLWKNK